MYCCIYFSFFASILISTTWTSSSAHVIRDGINSTENLIFSDAIVDDVNVTKIRTFRYPEARRNESIVDNYHGVEVKDPYRWLEDPDSEETKAFVDAQNSLTMPYLVSYPDRKNISDRLSDLVPYYGVNCPFNRGDKYFFFEHPDFLNQSESSIIVDSAYSDDRKIFAYSIPQNDSDWTTIHFINTETGEEYPDVLEKVQLSRILWTKDNKGIFYGAYPEYTGIPDGSETERINYHKLCYHYLGTPQSQDAIVVEFPEKPSWTIGARMTDCGNWLLIMVYEATQYNLMYVTKLTPGEKIVKKFNLTKVIDKFEADYEYITNDGSYAVFRTNKNAPNLRLMKINLEEPAEENWTVLIPEHPTHILEGVEEVDNDKLIVNYLKDVKNTLQLHSLKTGEFIRYLAQDIGTIRHIYSKKNESSICFKVATFLSPGIIYKMNLTKDQEPTVCDDAMPTDLEPKTINITQIFYTSKDGTKIPMFIIRKNDTVQNGKAPALLYGYGGFNYIERLDYNPLFIVFVQHFNGVVALANLRGGGEYGERWHDAGRRMNKQNVFDDFQAAAEYLIANNYTSSANLTIHGESNGGLLVAACINQRPDLFGVAIAHTGVMDMLRYHRFTLGYAWVSDYGNSDDPKHFENILKYSPLHNVRVPENDTQYPATLVITADHDDRVVPLHSLKLIATLQHTIGKSPQQKNPLLAVIETNAGHGEKKPAKWVEESTNILSFIAQTLGLRFKN